MDFLKKHYEKVVLGVVLLGLAVAVAFLPLKIAGEKQKLDEMRTRLISRNVQPLTNLDLSLADAALKRAAVPAAVDFSAPNKLFNPMLWQKTPEGRLLKADASSVGPNAVVVTRQTPLYLKLALDEVTMTDSGLRCRIGIENEAALNPRDRKKQRYCRQGDKNEVFAVREVRPLPNNPANATVALELNDGGQRVEISKDHPFQRVEGYVVDLKYGPENKVWNARRMGALLTFGGEEYNIVDITEDEIVLLAKSNLKKWTIKHSAVAAP